MGLRQIRVDRHVEARRSPFDAAQHQVLHCIEADCSARDGVAHRGSNLIGAEYLHQPQNLAKRARFMKNTRNLCNLSRRPARPAAGNGALQRMADRLLGLRGMVTVREVVEYAYAHRLLLGKERIRATFRRAVRRALESIGAIRIRRLNSIGRPWLWAMPTAPTGM